MNAIESQRDTQQERRGKLLVGLGLPGCGKSTVLRRLGEKLGIRIFLEPEEPDWPPAVLKRDECGHFSGLMWFRSIRVPMLHEADSMRLKGDSAIVDSYYDKLLVHWFGKPGMEWLFKREDPYFEVGSAIASLDYLHLPNADVIIDFHVDEHDWKSMLRKRNRDLDRAVNLSQLYATQEYFHNAAKEAQKDFGITILPFVQQYGSVDSAVRQLSERLRAEGILS